MSHPADSGASLIRTLLGESNSSLARAEETLFAGLAAASGLKAEVPTSTVRALQQIRALYEGLARRIGAVHTLDGDVKGQALGGVKAMIAGLTEFEDGLRDGVSKEAQSRLSAAAAQLERAAREMEAALG